MIENTISFEEALKKCDEISARILLGTLDLNECINAYSDGMEYLALAEKLLNDARSEFEKINPAKDSSDEL